MKRWKYSLIVIGLSFIAGWFLPASPASAQGRIAFIDMREVMVSSEAGKRASEEFKRTFDRERELIQAREAELKKMKDDIDRQRTVLSESALRERETTYQRRFRDYQILVRDSNEALQSRDQELTKTLLPEVLKVVTAIGEREKYAMIVDISSVPVAYYAKELDITKRIIDEFNRTHRPAKR